jgi:hypothetical protein
MTLVSDSRVRVIFGVLNTLVALILLVGIDLIQPRLWAVDLPIALLALAELVSAAALFARLPWALRALSVTAWITFGGGLILVALIVLTMVFLRSVHGEDGMVATAVSGLVVALIVPYTLLLPAVQLLWLKPRLERES